MARTPRQPMQWTIASFLEPIAGELWYDAAMILQQRGAHRDPQENGVLGELARLTGELDRMASDAQWSILPRLKEMDRTLRRLTDDFGRAVEFAKGRAAGWELQLAAGKVRAQARRAAQAAVEDDLGLPPL